MRLVSLQAENCLYMNNIGRWLDGVCEEQKHFMCEMVISKSELAGSAAVLAVPKPIQKLMDGGECIPDPSPAQAVAASSLPLVDIFVNPDREEYRARVESTQRNITTDYFTPSRMKEVYPDLFRLLWHSSLPCYHQPNQSGKTNGGLRCRASM